jgi:hypothetical protein
MDNLETIAMILLVPFVPLIIAVFYLMFNDIVTYVKRKINNMMEKLKKETVLEAAEKRYGNWHGAVDRINAFIEGAKWQSKQNSNWFNEYQEVENYIINRIGDNFLEATPEKYETASQAIIALLEANWQEGVSELLNLLQRSVEEINHIKNTYKDKEHCVKYLSDCEATIEKFKNKNL